MLEKIRKCSSLWFRAGETPAIEYTDALASSCPIQDRPNEGVFSFQDDDNNGSRCVRPDCAIGALLAENFDRLPKPYRSYRYGYVYRNESRPRSFRQFMQFDADTVGSASPAADAKFDDGGDTWKRLEFAVALCVKVNQPQSARWSNGAIRSRWRGASEPKAEGITID